MENNDFKNMIESARIERGLSQRELAAQIGLSQSTYNDTINGKIKKADIGTLKKIAEGLDLSLEKLLELSAYKDVVSHFGIEKYKNKSTKDFVDMIEEFREFKYDILSWDAKKRDKARKALEYLLSMEVHMKVIESKGLKDYPIDELRKNLEVITSSLEEIAKKYDYSKLPQND